MRYIASVFALSVLFWADIGIAAGIALHSVAIWHTCTYIAIGSLIALGVEIVRGDV
jgi:hypothetical protein